MARQIIDTGTLALNGQDGDTNRDAADKCNANFAELYSQNENFVRGAGVVQGGALVIFAGTTGNQVAAAPGGAPGTAAFKNTTDFASAEQGEKADNAQPKLSPGANITIDSTDPLNPVISASGGGAGTVQTVAGVDPVGGDIPSAELATALGVDNKLDADEAAASAVKLQDARNINGVSFDGTQDITIEDGTKEPKIATGTSAQYLNGNKAWADFAAAVRSAVLTGLSVGTATAVLATDSVLSGIGKLQAQISARARSGANSDITSLSGLTTPLSIAQGGNGGDSTPYLPSANGDSQLNNGKYSTQNSWSGSPYPGTDSRNYGYLEHFNWTDNQQQLQIWSSIDSSISRRYRFKTNGAWGAWTPSSQSTSWGSISGTISSQTDLQQALDALSSRVGAAIVTVNGGANIAVNQIYTVANPFPNEAVICEAQVLFGGVWANPRWFGTSGTTTYGTAAGQRFSTTAPGDIYVRTGISAMTVEPAAAGSAFPAGMGNQTALPCRVLVWRVKS